MNNLSDQDIEIIGDFVSECSDLLDRLEPVILNMLSKVKNEEYDLSEQSIHTLHEIFRLFHSIKGSAGFLNLNHISKAAHAVETVLDGMRTGAIKLGLAPMDLLCKGCYFTRDSLEYVVENLNDVGMASAGAEIVAVCERFLQEQKNGGQPEASTEKNDGMDGSESEMAITSEMLRHFVTEAEEQVQAVEQGLLNWANIQGDMDVIEELFRQIHSFKGNCGFMGQKDLERLSHHMETVIDIVRSGAQTLRGKPEEVLLSFLDIIRETLTDIAAGGKGEIDGLELYLEILQEITLQDAPGSPSAGDNGVSPKLGEILVEKGVVTAEDIERALAYQKKPIGEILVDIGAATSEDIQQGLAEQSKEKNIPAIDALPRPATATTNAIKRQDIRVDLEKLDALMNLIGEMVIAENMLINNHDLEGLELESFSRSAQHMNKIVKELQDVAMTIRMVPVAGLFHRMTRLVHDLSQRSGKKVDLVLQGSETELDKTVIEKITDPLVHMIRNSLDHGLEAPDERRKQGKPETGMVKLSANHEEGEVWITLEDDGRGLNREKVLAKAISQGLIEGNGSGLSNKEIADLIFLPGFSTAEKVTDISGRGVGMDVVRQNVAAINGVIDIHWQPGRGTRTILRIPLTMAIIDGMLIRVGRTKYIVPLLSIRESFRPSSKVITVTPDGQELVRVRDHLLRVIRLHEIHHIEPDHKKLTEGILIVLDGQETTFCLFVDEIMGQQQTVIKSLSDYITKIGNVTAVSGCTILGNGEICLILDIGGLGMLHGGRTEQTDFRNQLLNH